MRRGRGKEHREVKDERISGNLNDHLMPTLFCKVASYHSPIHPSPNDTISILLVITAILLV